MILRRTAGVALLAISLACGALPLGAGAQVPAQTLPPYAQPASDQTIAGRIAAINGAFNITVNDDKGTVDRVTLHRGTIINPTGLTLAAGMHVKIMGYTSGTTFVANEIDTPYQYAGPIPGPVYYGPGWWYPGFVYGYGPAFSISVHGGPPVLQRQPFPHNAPVTRPPYPPPPNRRAPEAQPRH